MAVYTNDLRLKEIATGDEAGTWGNSTNTNLQLIADAFGFGTEAITTNADTHTTTIADGSADAGRSIFLKYTGTLDSACTITIGPNTVSKLWLIENATSGSQNIIIKQGSGATVTIANGQTKAIYSDGAGSGGAMVDAFTDLAVPTLFAEGKVTIDPADGVADEDFALFVRNNEATAGRNFGLMIRAGSNASDESLTVRNLDNSSDFFTVHGDGTTTVNESGVAAADFRVESDGNTHMLFVDSGANCVNIGGSTDQGGLLNIEGSDADMLVLHRTADTGDQSILFKDHGDHNATITGKNGGGLNFLTNGTSTTALELASDGGATFGSGSGVIIDRSDNGDNLTLRTSDADASVGPILNLNRNSASPADNDFIGEIKFDGRNDAAQAVTYAGFAGRIIDASDGTEDGRFELYTKIGGAQISRVLSDGTETVINQDSSDLDFRVESNGNANMLFVDAGNDRVGIGSDTSAASTSSYTLSVKGSIPFVACSDSTASSQAYGGVGIYRTKGSNSEGTGISFQLNDDAGNVTEYSYIGTVIKDAANGSEDGEFIIMNTVANSSRQETARFSRDEIVMNEGSRDLDFRVESDSKTHMLFVNAGSNFVGVGNSVGAQTIANLNCRENGASIEFGHQNNTSGFFGTLGSFGSNGHPYIGFSCSSEASANTFSTFGHAGNIIHGDTNGNLLFQQVTTASATGQTPLERARILSTGDIVFGNTGSTVSNAIKTFIQPTTTECGRFSAVGGNNTNGGFFVGARLDTTAATVVIRPDGDIENINNTYAALSDQRLKQDIVDASSQWDDIKALKVRKYRFKSDPEKPLQIGVVAQELEGVSPGLVETTEDDITYGDGIEGGVKTVKYSVLYMKAIKALQEAMTRIETLETKVAALEGGS